MQQLKQSSTAHPLVFFLYQSSDHVTGLTGASPTVVISKDGASFGSPAGAVSEIGNGFYQVAGNATDTNTLGVLLLSATAASADQGTMAYQVVAFNPDSATNLGLTNLDATISSRLASASYTAPDNTSIGAIKTQTDKLTFDGSNFIKSDPQTNANSGDFNATQKASITAAVPDANANADALLKRDWTAVVGEASRSVLNSLRFLRNKWSISGTTLTVTKEDDSAQAWQAVVSTDAAAVPVVGADPT